MVLKITSTNIERMMRAVQSDMTLHTLDKPRVAITDHTSESGDAHVVNMDTLECLCKDYKHNCNEGEYCKHVWYAVFLRVGML